VLCGITLAFYHGLWLPGIALVKRDAFRAFPQIKHSVMERLSAGELPQWFPYEAMGRPFIGTAHAGAFHPFTALYFFLPPADAYRTSALLACLLAALGGFVLGRTLEFSRSGALISGLSLALSGYVASLTENIVYLYSISMLPLFCAGLEKALRACPVWVAAPAAVWATVFLNGDVQTGYYYIPIALAWTLARAPGSYRNGFFRLMLVGGLAFLLAGIQLGPTWAVFVDSERAHPALFREQALAWSTHPLRLMTVFASPVGTHIDHVIMARVFFETPVGGLLAESLYLGVPVTGLALLGAWYRHDLRVLALLGIITLILALGRFSTLYEVFYHAVPFWSAFRHPEKLLAVVFFTASMLAGAGLDALLAGKGCPTLWFVGAVLCAGAALGFQAETVSVWAASHFIAPEDLIHEVTGSASQAFLYSAVAAGGIWLITVGVRKQVVRELVAIPCLVALVTLDLVHGNLDAYHTGPNETTTFIPPFADAVKAQEGILAPGRFRILSLTDRIVVWPKDLVGAVGYYAAGSVERRQALDLEHNAEFRIETVKPYLPGFKAELLALLRPEIEPHIASRLNVTYYIGRRYHLKDPQFAQTLVVQLPQYDLALFRNPVPAKPRAYLSLQPERASAPVDPATLLARPDFLNGTVDVIETIAESLPGPARGGHATIEQYKPEEVRVRVETPQPAVLILLDAFDQGWTATLEDGVEVPIRRANALVRAVVVPAGAHMITFRYETPLLYAGAAASLFGVLLSLSLIVHARWRACQEDPVP
jgi:hypothetical protein